MVEKLRDCVETLLEEALLIQLEGKVSGDPLRTWDRKEVSRAEKEGPQHGPSASPHQRTTATVVLSHRSVRVW